MCRESDGLGWAVSLNCIFYRRSQHSSRRYIEAYRGNEFLPEMIQTHASLPELALEES